MRLQLKDEYLNARIGLK